MLRRVTNLVDLVLLLQDTHLILLPQHDCQPFPPSMKSSAFGVLMLLVILGNFCNFFCILQHVQPQGGVISVERAKNFVDLVFLLHYRHLILLAQHDCQPFPPSMKCSAFDV